MAKRNNQNMLGIVALSALSVVAVCCGGPCAILGSRQDSATPTKDLQAVASPEQHQKPAPSAVAPTAASSIAPFSKRPLVPAPTLPRTPTAVAAAPRLAPVEDPAQPLREWHSGKFKTDGVFVALVEDQVRLKKADGKVINVALETFDYPDRQYIRRTLRVDPLASVIIGKVIGVTDGDTITVLDEEKHQHKIRLEGIDAPESGQDFGSAAKKQLSEKLFDTIPWVEWRETDKYGRTLGHVYLNGRHINLELVADGLAWHYKQYSNDPRLANAELVARSRSAGLWSQPRPTPPWEFRQGVKSPTQNVLALPNGLAGDSPTTVASGDMTVFVTRSGGKYHTDGCRYLAKSKIPIALEQARSKYAPCASCNAPH